MASVKQLPAVSSRVPLPHEGMPSTGIGHSGLPLARIVLPSMVARGHGLEALCLYLSLTRSVIYELLVDLNLSTRTASHSGSAVAAIPGPFPTPSCSSCCGWLAGMPRAWGSALAARLAVPGQRHASSACHAATGNRSFVQPTLVKLYRLALYKALTRTRDRPRKPNATALIPMRSSPPWAICPRRLRFSLATCPPPPPLSPCATLRQAPTICSGRRRLERRPAERSSGKRFPGRASATWNSPSAGGRANTSSRSHATWALRPRQCKAGVFG